MPIQTNRRPPRRQAAVKRRRQSKRAPDLDFWAALHLATYAEKTAQLALVIAQRPLTAEERAYLAGWILSLNKSTEAPSPLPLKIPTTERNVAYAVRLMQAQWCKENSRVRTPKRVTDEMITEAIKNTARALKINATQLSAENIHRQLKTGRVNIPT